ncbi:MAG: DUF5063 domain-containing protein [Actinobacteria bacterium]|nr:DUF5063 domain-containing protein [Actinomycetota bacterium]
MFATVTKKYISLIDKVEDMTTYDFLSKCAILLPQIYYFGQLLPDVELLDKNKMDEASYVEWYALLSKKIAKSLGEHNVYMEVFDPVQDKEAIQASLADDLSEIYLELKQSLTNYETGDSLKINSAIWNWKFGILGHCGNHIVSALRPIHRLVFDYMNSEYK